MSLPHKYSSFAPGTAIIIHEYFNYCSWFTVTFFTVFKTTIHLFAYLLPYFPYQRRNPAPKKATNGNSLSREGASGAVPLLRLNSTCLYTRITHGSSKP